MSKKTSIALEALIAEKLQDTKEQRQVVGGLIEYLCELGWKLDQIVFGKSEWRVPKSPSEATKREKGRSYQGFPVDVAVFDSLEYMGDPHHLLFVIECKQPNENAGISQLEAYFVGEPHTSLGVWVNSPDPSAPAVFVYRKKDGTMLLKRRSVKDLPRPGEAIGPDTHAVSFNDLIQPTERIFRRIMEDLLDKVVIGDSNVTRREEQLDQLCNLLLLKLESDKQGRAEPSAPVMFRSMESVAKTGQMIKERYEDFVDLYPETFTNGQDKQLRFTNETIAASVEALSEIRLIDLGVSTVSVAFQVSAQRSAKTR